MLAHYIYFYLPRVFAQSATNTSDGPVATLSIYLYWCFNPPLIFPTCREPKPNPRRCAILPQGVKGVPTEWIRQMHSILLPLRRCGREVGFKKTRFSNNLGQLRGAFFVVSLHRSSLFAAMPRVLSLLPFLNSLFITKHYVTDAV